MCQDANTAILTLKKNITDIREDMKITKKNIKKELNEIYDELDKRITKSVASLSQEVQKKQHDNNRIYVQLKDFNGDKEEILSSIKELNKRIDAVKEVWKESF